MTHTVRPADIANTVAVGSHILPAMKAELERQGIRVLKVFTTSRLLRERIDDMDALTTEYESTFRHCKTTPGNVCAIVAKAEASDMRMLARDLCGAIPETKQRSEKEDAALMREEGIL